MREQILKEIRRLADANGGNPPGRRTFEKDTGITEGAWFGKYWARWGDAVADAGYAPNAINTKLNEQFVLEKLAEITRHYKKVPATMEMRLYKRANVDFPNDKTILSHFGGKKRLVERLAQWSRAHGDYADVADLIGDVEEIAINATGTSPIEGLVYLIKSGAHYKIGRSDQLEKRVKEIRVALPEAATLVHTIRTDDPSGIEAYWHRRFADRRANGEWFKLTLADVAAFKRRKYQ